LPSAASRESERRAARLEANRECCIEANAALPLSGEAALHPGGDRNATLSEAGVKASAERAGRASWLSRQSAMATARNRLLVVVGGVQREHPRIAVFGRVGSQLRTWDE
jgi:hypothetical protein